MAEYWNGHVAHRNGHAVPPIDPDVLIDYPSDRSTFAATALGADPRLRSGTVIYAGSTIGARLTTGHHVVIREENVVGDDVSIWTNSVIDYGCRIGDRVKIHSNCYIAQYTIIDDDAFLAPGVTIANDLYPRVPGSRTFMSGPHIEAGARIGVNVTLLPFVRIGAGALIGSGAVVTRDIPPGMVAYGSPARVAGRVADLTDIVERVGPHDTHADRFQLRVAEGTAGLR
jgi:acetyltransferase-like isoleucine patch superfamily enzyme